MSEHELHEHGHEHHGHEQGHAHHGPNLQTYLTIFIALSIFTVLSFVINGAVNSDPPKLTPEAGFMLILGVAIVKAFLVGLVFMHLKYDWGRLFFIIIPVSIMGVLLIVVLLPDILLAWHIDH